MEVKVTTTKTEKIKNLVRDNIDIIVGTGACLIGTGLIGLAGYKIGYRKGTRTGRNHVLDQIVDMSCYDGLVMKSPELGRYIFTAKKFSD